MAKKPTDGCPEIIFVGRKAKVPYKLIIFVVEDKDEQGVPRKLRIVLDHEKVKVEEGMEFMTGYVPQHMLRPDKGE